MNFRINIALIFLLFSFLQASSQNLVPNPSFETITNCPTSNSQFNLATPWQKPTSSITTPDLFNSCFSGGGSCTAMDVPGNFAGTAPARTGNGYAGLITKYTVANLREYLVIELSSPLVAGNSYDVGAYVRLATNSRYSTNNFGLHLSNGMLSQTTGCCNNGTINITPTIEEPAGISDRNNWTLVGDTYTANGGERYLTIGCFSPDNQNNIVDHGFQGGSCALVTSGAYYYLDDVFVRPSVTLDIEGLEFNAQATADDQGLLHWSFVDASLYDQVSIERSSDGYDFEVLAAGLDPALGTFVDPLPFAPHTWYRLKTIDENGEVQTSEVRQLSFEIDAGFVVTAWPNPLQDELNIRIQSDGAGGQFQVRLEDYLGRELHRQTLSAEEATVDLIFFDLGQLAQGIYFLRVAEGNRQQVIKLSR